MAPALPPAASAACPLGDLYSDLGGFLSRHPTVLVYPECCNILGNSVVVIKH